MRRDLGRALRGGWRRLRGRLHRARRRVLGGGGGAPDAVLADRVRSTIGPLEKRLDLPRLQVTVERGVAVLHGAVGSARDEAALVEAVAAVPGIVGVDARLHVGLTPADTRPSEGRRTAEPSAALRALTSAAAGAADLDGPDRAAAVSAVLSTLMERLPRDERDHLMVHLPEDVRALARHPRAPAAAATRIRTQREFAEAVEDLARLDGIGGITGPVRALVVSRAVLAELRRLVPEERADVAAVLPSELRELWAA